MAQRVSVLLVDDIDGSEAKETISFALDGTRYEINLNGEHGQELRGSWSATSRRPAGSPALRPTHPRPQGSADDKNKKVRDWARDQGLDVNDRSRIPAHIVAKYEAENGQQLTPSTGPGSAPPEGF